MSTDLFPAFRNIFPGLRRASQFLPCVIIFWTLIFSWQVSSYGQRQARTPTPQLLMPNFTNCVNVRIVIRWLISNRLRTAPPQQGFNACPAGTIYNHDPGPGVVASSPVTLYISLGPQQTPNQVTPTPVTPTPDTSIPDTPIPDTPTPIPTTPDIESPSPETPTPSPTPSPSRSPTPSGTPDPVVSPTPERDWPDVPWPWVLIAVLVPVSGVTAGKVLRNYIWDNRIEANVSLGQPTEIRMTRLEPPDDWVRTSVRILPGSVRFDGPIEIKEVEANDEQ